MYDFNAVFLLDEPKLIPVHNLYELTWIVKKGLPRLQRILSGNETLKFSPEILLEGYRGDQSVPRTEHLGLGTYRDESKLRDYAVENIRNLLTLERRRRRK